MDEIRVRLKIAEMVNAKYASRVLKRGGSPIWFLVGLAAALFVTIIGSRLVIEALGIRFPELQVYGPIALGVIVGFVLLRQRGKKKYNEVRSAPLNQLDTDVWVDAEGVHTSSEASRCSFAWSHIVDVMTSKDAILVLITPNQYLVIPYNKLPEGVTPAEAWAAIEAWRGAHAFT